MFIGKSTINEQFSIAILFYQRVMMMMMMMMMIDIMIYIYIFNDRHMMGNKIVMVLIIFYYGTSVPNPKCEDG